MILKILFCSASAILSINNPGGPVATHGPVSTEPERPADATASPTTPPPAAASAATGQNYDGLLNEAEKKYFHDDYDAAISIFNKAIALNPKSAAAYNGLGLCYYAQDKLDPAIQSFQKAAQADPGISSTYYNLGHCYSAKKQWDMAIMEYKKAIKDNPKHKLAQFELGSAYFAVKDFKKAKEQYEKAAKVLGENTPEGQEALRNSIRVEMLMQRMGR